MYHIQLRSGYIGSLMRFAPYNDGDQTDTAEALNQVYKEDLPTSRSLDKNRTILVVFTDGRSNAPNQTIIAANKLKTKATIFSVGIGKLEKRELNAIASKGKYLKITKFEEIKDLIQNIMNDESVCGTYDCQQIFRTANPTTMKTKGCSRVTGQSE